jgi:hypothetical protein
LNKMWTTLAEKAEREAKSLVRFEVDVLPFLDDAEIELPSILLSTDATSAFGSSPGLVGL